MRAHPHVFSLQGVARTLDSRVRTEDAVTPVGPASACGRGCGGAESIHRYCFRNLLPVGLSAIAGGSLGSSPRATGQLSSVTSQSPSSLTCGQTSCQNTLASTCPEGSASLPGAGHPSLQGPHLQHPLQCPPGSVTVLFSFCGESLTP